MTQASLTLEKLEELQNNLDRLLRVHHAVSSENELLKQQLDAVRKSITEKNKMIAGLEAQLEIQRTAGSIAHALSVPEDGEDKEEMRKRLNELIREVDNCIALLNA